MTSIKIPAISIITCTFNSEKYLVKALESVENQTYKNIEHIINDSYSTDETLHIIQKYIQRNKDKYKIRLIQSEPKGIGNALNVGTEEATGDLIHYLHSDDYYLNPFSVSKAVSYFFKDPNLVWLTGNFLVDLHGRLITIPQTPLLKINPRQALFTMNFISHENTFMKREAVQAYGGFNEKDNEVVEYSLWLNLIKDHLPLVVNEQYTAFIIHKGSRSTGSLFKFLKALRRAYHTQHKEKVLPLLGWYQEKAFYLRAKKILQKIEKFNLFKVIADIDLFDALK